MPTNPARLNSPAQVLFASMVGTTIEFFDFYIYATAAVLIFPLLFFPKTDPAAATLASFVTFGIAFLARPIGSALFGHFGDRIGRKRTLVVALSTMGLSTFLIGVLPSYASIGFAAPLLLALCRFGQGIGLGGEWGGAVLLAVENAPPGKRALYAMFPQLGAPIGFLLSGATFLVLSHTLTNAQLFRFGWRLPFLASAALVLVGLYVRLTITETRVFTAELERRKLTRQPTALPLASVFRHHLPALALGTFCCMATFVIFYLMAVFTLSWGTTALHIPRERFLLMQLFGVLFFGAGVVAASWIAERGRRATMLGITGLTAAFGLVLAPLFHGGTAGVLTLLVGGFFLAGLSYGPVGVLVSELFPTAVRYTGSSLAFNLASILGASLAPYIATWLATTYGLQFVGYYLSVCAVITLIALSLSRETRNDDIDTVNAVRHS